MKKLDMKPTVGEGSLCFDTLVPKGTQPKIFLFLT